MRDQKVVTGLYAGTVTISSDYPAHTVLNSSHKFLVILQGELQYFIGVQLDGSDHVEPLRNRLSETTEQQSAKLVCNLSLLLIIHRAKNASQIAMF